MKTFLSMYFSFLWSQFQSNLKRISIYFFKGSFSKLFFFSSSISLFLSWLNSLPSIHFFLSMSVSQPPLDDGRAELLICSPHQPIRVISARLSGQVSALQILWPNHPKRFIYNGMQLVETKTFLYYGINDGDSIIALPKNAYIGKFDQKSGQFSERNNRFGSNPSWEFSGKI